MTTCDIRAVCKAAAGWLARARQFAHLLSPMCIWLTRDDGLSISYKIFSLVFSVHLVGKAIRTQNLLVSGPRPQLLVNLNFELCSLLQPRYESTRMGPPRGRGGGGGGGSRAKGRGGGRGRGATNTARGGGGRDRSNYGSSSSNSGMLEIPLSAIDGRGRLEEEQRGTDENNSGMFESSIVALESCCRPLTSWTLLFLSQAMTESMETSC